MKEALTYQAFAALLAMVHMASCNPSHSHPRSPFYSFGGYILLVALWTIPLQAALIIRNVIHNRRLRLENQPTSQLQEVPETRPFNKH